VRLRGLAVEQRQGSDRQERTTRHDPSALVEVEEAIDRIVDIERWIGTTEERQSLSHP